MVKGNVHLPSVLTIHACMVLENETKTITKLTFESKRSLLRRQCWNTNRIIKKFELIKSRFEFWKDSLHKSYIYTFPILDEMHSLKLITWCIFLLFCRTRAMYSHHTVQTFSGRDSTTSTSSLPAGNSMGVLVRTCCCF